MTAVVSGGSTVLKELPRPIQQPEVAPVRDALCESLAAGFIAYEGLVEYAAEQSNPLTATGIYLEEYASEHGVLPGVNESEDSVRGRLWSSPKIVDPDDIRDQINAILSFYTTKKCTISEDILDGFFVSDGSAVWDSFIGVSPRYPDRFYPDDATENGGYYAAGSDPGGAIPATGSVLPNFHIRLPALDGDENITFCIDSTDEIMPISDGSDTSGSESDGSVETFIFTDYATNDEVYNSIAGLVESIKGQGVSWSLFVDPEL